MRSRVTVTVLLVLLLPAVVVEAAPQDDKGKLVDSFVDKYSKMSKGDFAFEQVQILNEQCKSTLKIMASINARIGELAERVSRIEMSKVAIENTKEEAVQSQRQLKLRVEELERKIEALELRQY